MVKTGAPFFRGQQLLAKIRGSSWPSPREEKANGSVVRGKETTKTQSNKGEEEKGTLTNLKILVLATVAVFK